ncbi:MAG: 3-dehydroquinate synthase family protein, partial [Rikenellaceae bacterium]
MDRIIEVKGNNNSRIIIGSLKTNLPQLVEGRKVVVITDENVFNVYSEIITQYPYIVIACGEQHKTLDDLDAIYSRLLELHVDRHSCIVGFGGGIVTDITGFVASTYQRGVDFGFVATSLLAQVDASVGGKNGVNHHGFKNMIGVFNQPRFVVCDVDLLRSLPIREFRAGLAEIIKAGVIKSRSLFEKFERNSFDGFYRDKSLLEDVIYESINIKAEVVRQDEHELGERKK